MNISTFGKCSLCGDFHWSTRKCHPAWLVWCPDDGEEVGDAQKVHAVDEEHAAEKWAEEDDPVSDYRIVSGGDAVVFIAPHDNPEQQPKRFRVSGESVPEYSAREVET